MNASRSCPSRNDTMLRRGQLRSRERSLHHDLVHRDRRTDDPRTDVGEVGELEEPLHGAVLTIRTVQEREDHVDVERGARTGGRVARRICDQLPDAFRGRAVDRERGRQRVAAATRSRRARCRRATSVPSVVIATGTISYRSGSSARATATAVARDTSCSADRPPKRSRHSQPTRHQDTCSTARIPRPMMKRPTRP